MSDLLEITTLGGLAIRRGGDHVSGMASRKVEALLVYVACVGRPRPREVLAELLWEERSQTRAMGNLRVALSSLRKHLGPYVTITRDLVALNAESDVWLDVCDLEQELGDFRDRRGQIPARGVARIEKALTLYHGDFLEGFHLSGSSGFENWAVLERERIRVVYEQGLQLLLDALLACRRWTDAIEWGERWIACGQTPEPAFRAVMKAYSGLGDLASMTAVYQRCAESLRLELDLQPSDQTRETFEHLASGGIPSVDVQVQPEELQAPTAETAARILLRQWRGQEAKVMDVASLAVVYAGRENVRIGPPEASLLIRSALHHGVDVEPWLRQLGSPKIAVGALSSALGEYPKPGVRMRIVEALKGVPGDQAAEALLQVATTDDAPAVRAAAALAAADRIGPKEVVAGLRDDLVSGGETVALHALVAVADRFGLPADIGPYPKLPVALGLARRRWQAHRGAIVRQTVRAGAGAALAWALFGMTTPLYVALALPEDFGEITQGLLSASAWMLVSTLGALVVGAILGMASGFAIGVADALWTAELRTRWRILAGGLAGLAHSAYLILFALVGAFEPMAPPSVYIPADIVYGIVQGLIVAFAIPQLGSGSSFRQQLIRSACAGGVSALTAVPYVFSVSPAEPIVLFLSRLLNAFLLPFGVGLALSRRGSRRQTE